MMFMYTYNTLDVEGRLILIIRGNDDNSEVTPCCTNENNSTNTTAEKHKYGINDTVPNSRKVLVIILIILSFSFIPSS